ncbi:MAG: hypothetical protein IPJ40_07080 [Saprospirales bacterium]|nr:hypothetical protein [Saprospirales bacterium]
MWVNNYDYPSAGEEDALLTLPIDLSDANENTLLTFDLAYSVYNLNQWWDALRVDVYTDCGDTFAGTVYYKAKIPSPPCPRKHSLLPPLVLISGVKRL